MEILTDSWQFLQEFWFVLTSALGFSTGVTDWVIRASRWDSVLILIVMLGGASLLLGQSAILFVNRVTPKRFVMSLVLNGVLLLANLFIWAFGIWLVGLLLFGSRPDYRLISNIVALSYAPYIFGVFVLMPYLGNFWQRIIEVWSLMITLYAIRIVYSIDWWAAIICVGLGWLLITFLSRTVGRPLVGLREWLIEQVAGSRLESTVQDILTFTPEVAARSGIASSAKKGDES